MFVVGLTCKCAPQGHDRESCVGVESAIQIVSLTFTSHANSVQLEAARAYLECFQIEQVWRLIARKDQVHLGPN